MPASPSVPTRRRSRRTHKPSRSLVWNFAGKSSCLGPWAKASTDCRLAAPANRAEPLVSRSALGAPRLHVAINWKSCHRRPLSGVLQVAVNRSHGGSHETVTAETYDRCRDAGLHPACRHRAMAWVAASPLRRVRRKAGIVVRRHRPGCRGQRGCTPRWSECGEFVGTLSADLPARAPSRELDQSARGVRLFM